MNGDKKLLLKGGKLVKSKSGKLLLWTPGCVCCDQEPPVPPCQSFFSNADIGDPFGPPASNGQWCGRWEGPLEQVTIPSKYKLPCRIRITGWVDDDIMIDGKILEEGRYKRGWLDQNGNEINCNPAHFIGVGDNGSWVMEMKSRTFDIKPIDNIDTNVGSCGYNITICFGVKDELSTWPNVPNPLP